MGLVGLRDLVRFEREKPRQLPAWLDRIVSAGVVTNDPKVARRHRFVNVTSYFAAMNTAARFVQNFTFDYADFVFVQSIVVFFLLWALAIHRLHRFGENVAAVVLAIWFLSGISLVVVLFGLQSGAQMYFATVGIFLLLIGIEHWRIFLVTLVAVLVVAFVTLSYGPEVGFALPADSPLVFRLVLQATIVTIVINTVVLAYALVVLQRTEQDLERQSARADALLGVVLPERIAKRLHAEPEARIADRIENVSLLFADLADFTPVAHAETPERIVAYLDEFVRTFDLMCEERGVEKIKSIGDAYMAAGGLRGDPQAAAVVIGTLALEMVKVQERRPPLGGRRLQLRIGLHVGPAIAGVIGDTRISYDLWGDAVNVASRMESFGVPGRVHVSDAFRRMTEGEFEFEERGATELKGIGVAQTYFLLGRSSGGPAMLEVAGKGA
jgi:adenylate cyclase